MIYAYISTKGLSLNSHCFSILQMSITVRPAKTARARSFLCQRRRERGKRSERQGFPAPEGIDPGHGQRALQGIA